MRYNFPIHPIPIGSIIKYNVREYGYFYGDGQEKRAITIAKIGKVVSLESYVICLTVMITTLEKS